MSSPYDVSLPKKLVKKYQAKQVAQVSTQILWMQNYKGARRAFQTCVAVDPDFSKAWVSWAQVRSAWTFWLRDALNMP